MSLAEQQLRDREFTTLPMPFSLCCYKCDVIIRVGALALRYDGATYAHESCPTTPHKTFAPHKYGSN